MKIHTNGWLVDLFVRVNNLFKPLSQRLQLPQQPDSIDETDCDDRDDEIGCDGGGAEVNDVNLGATVAVYDSLDGWDDGGDGGVDCDDVVDYCAGLPAVDCGGGVEVVGCADGAAVVKGYYYHLCGHHHGDYSLRLCD